MNKQKQKNKKNVQHGLIATKTFTSSKECNVYSSDDEDFQLFLNERKKKQEIFRVYDKTIKKILKKVKSTNYVFEKEKIEKVGQDTEDEALEDINLILRNESYNVFSKRNKNEKQKNKEKLTTLELSKKNKNDELIFRLTKPKWNELEIEEDKINLYEEHREMTKNLRSGLCNELNNYFLKIFGNVKNVEALNEQAYEDGTLEEYLFYENNEQNINSWFDKNNSFYVNNNEESLKLPTINEEKNLCLNKMDSNENINYKEPINTYNCTNGNLGKTNKDSHGCNPSTENYIEEIKHKNESTDNEKKQGSNTLGYNFSVVTTDTVVNTQKKKIGSNKRKTYNTQYQNYKNYSQGKRIHTTLDKNTKPNIYEYNEENFIKRKKIQHPNTNEMNYRTIKNIQLSPFKNNCVTDHYHSNNDHSCHTANIENKEHLKISTNNNPKVVPNKDWVNFINNKESTERIEKEKEVSLQEEEEFSFQHFKKNSNNREIKQKLIYRIY